MVQLVRPAAFGVRELAGPSARADSLSAPRRSQLGQDLCLLCVLHLSISRREAQLAEVRATEVAGIMSRVRALM